MNFVPAHKSNKSWIHVPEVCIAHFCTTGRTLHPRRLYAQFTDTAFM